MRYQPIVDDYKVVLYVIGALGNPRVPVIANQIRKGVPDLEVFDSWYSPGPLADSYWREYEKAKGLTLVEALQDYAARHIYEFDLHHLNRASAGLLIAPAGKSCHLELGYLIGQGKPGFVLLDGDPPKWDVMLNFASGIYYSTDELADRLRKLVTTLRGY